MHYSLRQSSLKVVKADLDAPRPRTIAAEAEADKPRIWHDGAKTSFNLGTNGRWQGVLTTAELAMYEQRRVDRPLFRQLFVVRWYLVVIPDLGVLTLQ